MTCPILSSTKAECNIGLTSDRAEQVVQSVTETRVHRENSTLPQTVTRFAPSPSGWLHLGHIHSVLEARRAADDDGGLMRLRIEDIDGPRCRPEYHDGILDDLTYMGVKWDGPVMVQSERMAAYAAALETLKADDLVYPCFLSRRELDRLLSAPHLPPITHPANTDQLIDSDLATERLEQGQEPAWRLRMEAIRPRLKGLEYRNWLNGPKAIDLDAIGDEVIARKDIATSYHLSVVVDDAAQGITLITRGADLEASTPLHRVLQVLLNLPETTWRHHQLVLDSTGKRLAKRHMPLTIRDMREDGMEPSAILSALEKSPKA